MKILGYLLITAGFLAGAYFAVLPAPAPEEAPEPPPLEQPLAGEAEPAAGESPIPLGAFLGSLALGVLGVALVRLTLRAEARHEDTLSANIETLEASLEALLEEAETLDRDKEGIDVFDLRHRIDDTFPSHLDAFVQARKSIAHSFGLQAYADVMSAFAAGERHLNRVWSASTDGYIDEAHTYIGLSKEHFEEALGLFRHLQRRDREEGKETPGAAPATPVG